MGSNQYLETNDIITKQLLRGKRDEVLVNVLFFEPLMKRETQI